MLNRDSAGAFLAPVELTWVETFTLLSLLERISRATEYDALRDKLRNARATIEAEERTGT